MSDVVKQAWSKYMLQLQVNPLRTMSITSGFLAGFNDALSQKFSGVKKLQLRRLLLMALFGFAYGGPFGYYFHKLMHVIFKGKNDSKTVAKMVLFEQLTSSPWNNMLFILFFGLVIERRPWASVKNSIKTDFIPIQLTAWKFWSVVAWVNNQYLPLELRVPFISIVATCWSIFMNLKVQSAAINES